MKVLLRAQDKLLSAVIERRSLLCVGLDPDYDRIPVHALRQENPIVWFNRAIIDATQDLVAAYKLNLAFYESRGEVGWSALKRTIASIPGDVMVILDAKRSDVGHTARHYAEAMFDGLGGDAVTVNPYLGRDGIEPFTAYRQKLTFLLAATSNPGAAAIQDSVTAEGLPLYRHVARLGRELAGGTACVGLVAGATQPEKLRLIRQDAPDLWLLVPGIGAQGGDLATTLQHGLNPAGHGVLINASRSVLYAATDTSFADAARAAARELRDAINHHRPNT
ncbi:MAG: orotidine-5'-phosphate decarboxylase [Candidatus Sericytochromatia bacterium]|nr:orotidine-5'-phosphate decarboxylase [Candidatus Sericytochromatia bacterium]